MPNPQVSHIMSERTADSKRRGVAAAVDAARAAQRSLDECMLRLARRIHASANLRLASLGEFARPLGLGREVPASLGRLRHAHHVIARVGMCAVYISFVESRRPFLF